MAFSGEMSPRCRQVANILGMAVVWPSIHNQVLYPLTFSFHKVGATSPYIYYVLYSAVMLVAVLAVLFMAKKQIVQHLFASRAAVASIGVMGSLGIALLVVCDYGSGFARWFMGIGVALSAVFVPLFFMFWSVQIVHASKKRAAFDLMLSYVVFCLITLFRLSLGLHAWMFSIAYPLVSAALAAWVLTVPEKSHYALDQAPLPASLWRLLVPCVAFVYVGTVARLLLNPADAAFDYPPYHRLLIYVILLVVGIVLAVLYRPHGKARRNADTLAFSLASVFLVGAILLTSVGLADAIPFGNLPVIAGVNAMELFIWVVVAEAVQVKHAGIVRPAACFLVFVMGATHLVTVLALGGASTFQLDASRLPLMGITVALAFLVVAVVMSVLSIMLYNARKGQAEGALLSPAEKGRGAGEGALCAAGGLSQGQAGPGCAAALQEVDSLPPCLSAAANEAAVMRVQESFGLSKRETDTLRLAARSKSAKEIADALFVAESTVNSHIKGIYRKCDVHSRQELIALVNRFKEEGD